MDEIDSLLQDLQSGGKAPAKPNHVYEAVVKESPYEQPRPVARPAPAPPADDLDALMAELQSPSAPPRPSPSVRGPPPSAPAPPPGTQAPPAPAASAPVMKGMRPVPQAPGHCAVCRAFIEGSIIDAIGMEFHPDHFTCMMCNKKIGTEMFYEREGVVYCTEDYHQMFFPKCAYCNNPVVENGIAALGKKWHHDHFFCSQCGKGFGADGFMEKDGRAYCPQDYYAMFAASCARCNKIIQRDSIAALDSQWHPECFVCWDCNVPFVNGEFYALDNKPYCAMDFHKVRGTLCAACNGPIAGKCISAMGKKFHHEHFTCAFCLKPLANGVFKEKGEKPYCNPCYIKLYG